MALPSVVTDTRSPAPARSHFSDTSDPPWPLYQGSGEEGFVGPGIVRRSFDIDARPVERRRECWRGQDVPVPPLSQTKKMVGKGERRCTGTMWPSFVEVA